jgi:hypothetical protein
LPEIKENDEENIFENIKKDIDNYSPKILSIESIFTPMLYNA